MSLRRATVLLTAAAVLLLGGGAVVAEEPNYGPLDTQCRVFGKWFSISSSVEDHNVIVTPEHIYDEGSDLKYERVFGLTVEGFEDWPDDRYAIYQAPASCKDCGAFVAAHVRPVNKYSYHPCKLKVRSYYTADDLKANHYSGGVTYSPDTLN